MAVGNATANLLGYGFFLVLNRTQSPTDLGAIVALTNLAVIGAVPALALQLVIARRVARAAPAERESVEGTALRTGMLTAVAVAALTVALAPVVTWMLHLPSPAPALLLALVTGPTCVTYAVLGHAQGTDRFVALSALYVLVGLTRLLAGVVGAVAGWGVTGVVGALAAAAILSGLVALMTPGMPRLVPVSLRIGPTWRGPVLSGMTATSALLVVSSLDAPLARHFLEPVAAGEFAVLTIFTKAAFWAPAFVATVVYSRMATRRGARHVGLAIGVTAAIVGVGVMVAALARGPLIVLVGGARYEHLAALVPLFTAVGGLWALTQVFVYWRLAREDHRFGLLLWVAAAGIVVTVAVATHGSVAELAWTLLAGGCTLVATGMVLLAVAVRRHRDSGLLMGDLAP